MNTEETKAPAQEAAAVPAPQQRGSRGPRRDGNRPGRAPRREGGRRNEAPAEEGANTGIIAAVVAVAVAVVAIVAIVIGKKKK